jgi:hypothetical protein
MIDWDDVRYFLAVAPDELMIDKDEVSMRSWPGLAGVPVEAWIEPSTVTPLNVSFATWMVPTAGFKSHAVLVQRLSQLPVYEQAARGGGLHRAHERSCRAPEPARLATMEPLGKNLN